MTFRSRLTGDIIKPMTLGIIVLTSDVMVNSKIMSYSVGCFYVNFFAVCLNMLLTLVPHGSVVANLSYQTDNFLVNQA